MNIVDKIKPILDTLEKSPEATIFTHKLKEDVGKIIITEIDKNATSHPFIRGLVVGFIAAFLVMAVV